MFFYQRLKNKCKICFVRGYPADQELDISLLDKYPDLFFWLLSSLLLFLSFSPLSSLSLTLFDHTGFEKKKKKIV